MKQAERERERERESSRVRDRKKYREEDKAYRENKRGDVNRLKRLRLRLIRRLYPLQKNLNYGLYY